ncbi:MAG: N-acetylmuramoyl-L-alanine amidase [Clostridiales bacterium]|nr:N-acetylmuramoyl-L-alanine amidase [Clostridiales bacterium]
MKRFKAWFTIALGILGILFLLLAHYSKNSHPIAPTQEEPSSLPLSGRVIFVDAGHGGADGGARAKDSKVWEKEINLQVALAVKAQLEESGALVVMSRERDMEYDTNKRKDLTARLDLAREQGTELVISIHMNEYRSRTESGPQVFYRKNQEKSRLLAGVLQEHLIRVLEPEKKRAAMAGDYFILSSSMPSVLVECGFLSNAREEALLLTPEYQQKIAIALRDGIIAYFTLPVE